MAGTQDHAIDDALFMAARWRAAGSPAKLEIVAEAIHGFTLFPTSGHRQVGSDRRNADPND